MNSNVLHCHHTKYLPNYLQGMGGEIMFFEKGYNSEKQTKKCKCFLVFIFAPQNSWLQCFDARVLQLYLIRSLIQSNTDFQVSNNNLTLWYVIFLIYICKGTGNLSLIQWSFDLIQQEMLMSCRPFQKILLPIEIPSISNTSLKPMIPS